MKDLFTLLETTNHDSPMVGTIDLRGVRAEEKLTILIKKATQAIRETFDEYNEEIIIQFEENPFENYETHYTINVTIGEAEYEFNLFETWIY